MLRTRSSILDPQSSIPTCDIFCKVIDNFGDVGVCWRLGRQLSAELAFKVRLFVDDVHALSRIWPAIDPQAGFQRVENVEILRWQDDLDVVPADIVVEAFGAAVDGPYLHAMAERQPSPVWILLEYLSAEPWVEGCHGLPSPHPRLSLVKYFFFPGFTAATGGLLIERDLVARRDALQGDAAARGKFFDRLGVPRSRNACYVSLFAYENAGLPALIDVWSASEHPIICIVPVGAAGSQLERVFHQSFVPGTTLTRGSLTITAIPFLDIDAYDHLLWACDINFVRGEDSFVRAQLAARPLVWQAYPQQESAQRAKVDAFLDRYTGAQVGTASAHRSLVEAWNGASFDVAACWDAFYADRGEATARARDWADTLVAGPTLAESLAAFCTARLK